jgi:tetratricopeptide (TPR) repeat protein
VASRDITRARLARVQLLGGRVDEALETLAGGRFHVWEGERGIHEVYVEARLEQGRRKLAAGDVDGALAAFRAAVTVPPNIEVGRDTEAHLPAVRFHEGLALAALGREAEAAEAFRWTAAAPAGSPSDHYWAGQALVRLGREGEGHDRFQRLARTEVPAVDEGLPLERRMGAIEGRAEAEFLRALGLLGLGRESEARRSLARSLEIEPSHLGAVELRRSLPPPGNQPETGGDR